MRYAEATTVPAASSRAEIERIVCRHAGRFAGGRRPLPALEESGKPG